MTQHQEKESNNNETHFEEQNKFICDLQNNSESSSPINQGGRIKTKKIKFEILGLTENETNTELLYQVKIGERIGWVKKDFFIPKRLSALLEFYEENILFRENKPQKELE